MSIEIELGSLAPRPRKPREHKPQKPKVKKPDPARKALPAKQKREAELERLRAEAEEACAVVSRMKLSDEDAEQLNQYRHMFDKLISIARLLESNIESNKTSRDVYPLMQVYNQMREVIADMRALRDIGSMCDNINDEVLHPMVQSVAQDMGGTYQEIRALLTKMLTPQEAELIMQDVNKSFSSLASKLQITYEHTLDKTQRVLGGGV